MLLVLCVPVRNSMAQNGMWCETGTMAEWIVDDCENCPYRQDPKWAEYAARCNGRRVGLDRAAAGELICGAVCGPDASRPSITLEQWDKLHFLTLGHITDLYERGELPG